MGSYFTAHQWRTLGLVLPVVAAALVLFWLAFGRDSGETACQATVPTGLLGPTGAHSIGSAIALPAPHGLLGPTGPTAGKVVTVTVTVKQRVATVTSTIRERSNGRGGWVAIP